MLSTYRKYQWMYIAVDAVTSVMVWLSFLLFRWLVYEGKVFGVESVLIPAFDFYRPLFLYPMGCLCVHYLTGYYITPLRRKLSGELLTTLISALIISLGSFFVIIIDDKVANYQNYLGSLLVLFCLQFSLCYLPRLLLSLLMRTNVKPRVYTLHSCDELPVFFAQHESAAYDEVVIDLPLSGSEKDIYHIIKQVYPLGVGISVVPRVYDMLIGAARIGELTETPLVRITTPTMSSAQMCIKRAFDVLCSLALLILLSPLYLVLAILVRCSSPGPVIYRQERIGLHGVPFQILKFRTMYEDSEGQTPQLTSDDDPRVTPLGAVLRKYRLDELPQMWNILRGDMSFVGPRPERAYFIRSIEEQAPYYCLLYKIRPGLTSWGPIRVGYTDTMEKMIQRLNYDIVYMENMSLRLDVKILFYTFGVIIDGKGK